MHLRLAHFLRVSKLQMKRSRTTKSTLSQQLYFSLAKKKNRAVRLRLLSERLYRLSPASDKLSKLFRFNFAAEVYRARRVFAETGRLNGNSSNCCDNIGRVSDLPIGNQKSGLLSVVFRCCPISELHRYTTPIRRCRRNFGTEF